MRYYRCKCGRHESWGSMGPNPCARCKDCGSDLAGSPDTHAEPKPHRMLTVRATVETDEGEKDAGTMTRCVWCLRTLAQIREAGQPFEMTDT